MNEMISILIPAYNVQNYINKCIDSVLTQTYQNFEIIIVNDGSTDNTYEQMEFLQMMDSRIKIFDSVNKGQGYQRNRMLEIARGDYVLFLDSDDYLEPRTLELALNRIVEDQSDFVYFDWKYYYDKNGRFNYLNTERIFGRKTLEGDDCLLFLSISPYFSVNRLYSREFLVSNNIKYGEGHIYEDNPFIVATAFYAKKISIIHSPLYVVRVSENSSTKSNTDSDFHYQGFIKSVQMCRDILKQKPDDRHYYYYKYALTRYFVYIRARIPKHLRKQFTRDFLETLSDIELHDIPKNDKVMKFLIKHKVFKKKKTAYLRLLTYYFKDLKPKKRKFKNSLRGKKNRIFASLKKPFKKAENQLTPPNQSKEYKEFLKLDVTSNTVLFLGFDFRYTGNSRYLFEMMIRDPGEKVIYFATEDEAVDEQYRLQPYSVKFYEILATANILIFESWTLPTFRKRLYATWIQLWHGTPLKKMLFDSEEAEIITIRKKHKINKYIDIQKWDHLVTDTPEINRYFETSFLFPEKKFISCGYPRVKYLVDNKDNEALKKEIKEKYNICGDKEIVVYLPTWRDYNYGKTEDIDNDYLLDTALLQENLGDRYCVIDKNHSYLNTLPDANQNMETQELLLVADYLVTDYSSVMFDAFAIDIPVAIYSNDFEKYQASRGVYLDMWEDLKPFVSDNMDDLCRMIGNYTFGSAYQYVKEKYCFRDNVNQLLKRIDNILASGDPKKRILFKLDCGSGITADRLRMLRKAAELCHELYVLIDDNTKDKRELCSYKIELEQFKYVSKVLIKDEVSIEEILQERCIDAIAAEDTPDNRTSYENKYSDYEVIFIK